MGLAFPGAKSQTEAAERLDDALNAIETELADDEDVMVIVETLRAAVEPDEDAGEIDEDAPEGYPR